MDTSSTPKKGKKVPGSAWTDSYTRGLEFLKKDLKVKVVHIETGYEFNYRTGKFVKDTGKKYANQITAFIRRYQGHKMSAGIEFRLLGVLEDEHFQKSQGFNYRTRKKKNGAYNRRDEVIITKFLNTTKEKHLVDLMKQFKKEVRRFFALHMRNDLLEMAELNEVYEDVQI